MLSFCDSPFSLSVVTTTKIHKVKTCHSQPGRLCPFCTSPIRQIGRLNKRSIGLDGVRSFSPKTPQDSTPATAIPAERIVGVFSCPQLRSPSLNGASQSAGTSRDIKRSCKGTLDRASKSFFGYPRLLRKSCCGSHSSRWFKNSRYSGATSPSSAFPFRAQFLAAIAFATGRAAFFRLLASRFFLRFFGNKCRQ